MFLGIVNGEEQPCAPQRDDDRIVRADEAGGPALGPQLLSDLSRKPTLAHAAGAGQETDAGVAALPRPLQECVPVFVPTGQRRQARTPRQQREYRLRVVGQVAPRQERLARLCRAARVKVNAGSDPDVIENDGGRAGIGRRQGFFGLWSSVTPARMPVISA